ncbi:MAG: glycosyltransferase [Actinobacteria bacterium]|nr:glycosyltransferase [Actinomycetota bacterium]
MVIPTRDRWPLLGSRALPSALEQEGVELEVVVVDDGSTDGTSGRLAGVDDARLRVVRRDRTGGMAAARNAGIAVARGEWIAFLDDDDVWSPRKLSQQLGAARGARADFVYAGAIAVDERGIVLDTLYLPRPDELREKLSRASLIPAGCSNVIARTSLLRSLGGFDETFVHIADWDLWIGLEQAGSAAFCEDVLVAYLLHPGNIHAIDDPSTEIDRLVRKHASATPPRRMSPDRLGYSRWVAGQRSRAGLHTEAAQLYFRSALRYRSLGNLMRGADALLAKRGSAGVRRVTGRQRRTPPPAAAPDWLRRYAT